MVEEPVSAFVSYDDTAGAITASVTFNNTSMHSMSLALLSDCSHERKARITQGPSR